MKSKIFLALVLIFALVIQLNAEWRLLSSELNSKQFTDINLQGWKFIDFNEAESPINKCGDNYLIGGYNSLGIKSKLQKTFKEIQEHQIIKVTLTLYQIDNWEEQDQFVIYANGMKVYTVKSSLVRFDICGNANNNFGEGIINVNFEFPHTDPDLQLELTSTLTKKASDASWGIRNMNVFYKSQLSSIIVAEEFQQNDFDDSAVHHWVSNKNHGMGESWITKCNDTSIFGGFPNFFLDTKIHKTFKDLPNNHYYIIVEATFYFFDEWDFDQFFMYVDDNEAYNIIKSAGAWRQEKGSYCNADVSKIEVVKIAILIPHSKSEIKLQFIDVLERGTVKQSYGIRDLKISAVVCSNNCQILAKEMFSHNFNSKYFEEQKTNWLSVSPTEETTIQKTQQCGDYTVFGKFSSEIIKRTFTNIENHNELFITFKIFYINEWDYSKFTVYIDGMVFPKTFKTSVWGFQEQRCDKYTNVKMRVLTMSVPHISSEATIEFKSFISESSNDHFWGIRDLFIGVKKPKNNILQYYQYFDQEFKLRPPDNGWTVVNNISEQYTSKCNQVEVLGGYKVFNQESVIKLKLDNLEPHDIVTITIKFYFFDMFETNNVYVQIDNQFRFLAKQDTIGAMGRYCNSESMKEEVHVSTLQFLHDKPTMLVTIFTGQFRNKDEQYWGIRDFQIWVINATFTYPKIVKTPLPSSLQSKDDKMKNVDNQCIVLYDKCMFRGNQYNVCQSIPKIDQKEWSGPIKSIFIPAGWAVKFFEEEEYKGKKYRIDTSEKCLTGIKFELVNKKFNLSYTEAEINQGSDEIEVNNKVIQDSELLQINNQKLDSVPQTIAVKKGEDNSINQQITNLKNQFDQFFLSDQELAQMHLLEEKESQVTESYPEF